MTKEEESLLNQELTDIRKVVVEGSDTYEKSFNNLFVSINGFGIFIAFQAIKFVIENKLCLNLVEGKLAIMFLFLSILGMVSRYLIISHRYSILYGSTNLLLDKNDKDINKTKKKIYTCLDRLIFILTVLCFIIGYIILGFFLFKF